MDKHSLKQIQTQSLPQVFLESTVFGESVPEYYLHNEEEKTRIVNFKHCHTQHVKSTYTIRIYRCYHSFLQCTTHNAVLKIPLAVLKTPSAVMCTMKEEQLQQSTIS